MDDQDTRFYLWQPMPEQAASDSQAQDRQQLGYRQGDVAYLTLEVKDSARARAFYGAVLGWRFTPGRAADGWGIDDIMPMTGMQGGHDETTAVPMYRVDDIHTAVERVRAADGNATEPRQEPYGLMSNCTDDQGTRFTWASSKRTLLRCRRPTLS